MKHLVIWNTDIVEIKRTYRAYILSLEYVRYTNIPRLPRLPVIMYYSSFYIVAQYLWFVCQNYIYCLAISIHTQLALLACILLLGRFIVCKNSMGMISCIIIDGILIFYWRNYWMEYGHQRKKALLASAFWDV